MTIKDRLQGLIARARKGHIFRLETAKLEVVRQLEARMEELDISPSELAQKMDASQPYVSKILRGNTNFTLDSLVKLASATDAEFKFQFAPEGCVSYWVNVSTTKPKTITAEEISFSSAARYSTVATIEKAAV